MKEVKNQPSSVEAAESRERASPTIVDHQIFTVRGRINAMTHRYPEGSVGRWLQEKYTTASRRVAHPRTRSDEKDHYEGERRALASLWELLIPESLVRHLSEAQKDIIDDAIWEAFRKRKMQEQTLLGRKFTRHLLEFDQTTIITIATYLNTMRSSLESE